MNERLKIWLKTREEKRQIRKEESRRQAELLKYIDGRLNYEGTLDELNEELRKKGFDLQFSPLFPDQPQQRFDRNYPILERTPGFLGVVEYQVLFWVKCHEVGNRYWSDPRGESGIPIRRSPLKKQ